MNLLRRLDASLARLSMYRLVLGALAVLLAVAMVLGATGTIFFTPLDLALTAATACLATLGATWLGGALTRTRPHVTSSLITGQILTFVLWPGSDLESLLAAAIAGAAAGASKYLIAWRGRHLVNPAVVGLLVVTWTDTGIAGWWVGSRELAPAVVILGLVVLWRTRRLIFALSFLVPAVALGVLGYLRFDTPPGDAVSWALIASPVLFLSAFMLTEPLTSPPRRWQRVLVGAGVGVLGVVPLFAEAPWLSWELALAAGNVVAFGLGLRGGVRLRLVSSVQRGDMLDLSFEASRPLRFAAGQYVEVDVPQALAMPGAARDSRGRRRMLSVASAPGSPVVRLVTRLGGPVVGGPVLGGSLAGGPVEPAQGSLAQAAGSSAQVAPPSPVKRALAAMAPGESIAVTGVAGDFLLPVGGPVALVAAGVGVTPFLSHLEAAARGELQAPAGGWDVVLVYAVREVADVVPLAPGVERLAGLRTVLVVPQGQVEAAVAALPGWQVVAGDALTPQVLAEAVPDLAAREVLASGSPAAVAAVRRAARADGAERVRSDVFLGY